MVFVFASHWLGCTFFYLTTRKISEHYKTAPWVLPDAEGAGVATSTRYLWASYWSSMSLTTTGHMDVVDVTGHEWEVGVAIIVVLFSTFCFTYMNANITSLIMRHTQALDKYRQRLTM
eukprot:6649335-Prymnesium_polylepis.1